MSLYMLLIRDRFIFLQDVWEKIYAIKLAQCEIFRQIKVFFYIYIVLINILHNFTDQWTNIIQSSVKELLF